MHQGAGSSPAVFALTACFPARTGIKYVFFSVHFVGVQTNFFPLFIKGLDCVSHIHTSQNPTVSHKKTAKLDLFFRS